MEKKFVSLGIIILLLMSIMLAEFEIRSTRASSLTSPEDGSQIITLNSSTSWYWTSTTSVKAVSYGDFNNDLQTEIVTGGSFFDGTRNVAQLIIWNSNSLVAEKLKTWYWTGNTSINSIATGDVNGDNQTEIVTGGSFFDGTRNVAQLIIWNASSLAQEKATSWYWTGDTVINSIAIGDVNTDGEKEIVSAGYYNDGTRNIAQIAIWSGSALALEKVKSMFWVGNTVVNSLAIGDVDNDGQAEIVTGGNFNDGTSNIAQLIEWKGADLIVDRLTSWYWTGDTVINSVAIGQVNNDGQTEIITSGFYSNGTHSITQLIEWKGADLIVDRLTNWNWTDKTVINSVAIGDVNNDGQIEVITSGSYFDGSRSNAQLVVWSGSSLAVESIKTWYWKSDTSIKTAVVADINGDLLAEIIAGGEYFDGARLNAQLTIWNIVQNPSSNYKVFGIDFSSFTVALVLAAIIVLTIVIGIWFLRRVRKSD